MVKNTAKLVGIPSLAAYMNKVLIILLFDEVVCIIGLFFIIATSKSQIFVVIELQGTTLNGMRIILSTLWVIPPEHRSSVFCSKCLLIWLVQIGRTKISKE